MTRSLGEATAEALWPHPPSVGWAGGYEWCNLGHVPAVGTQRADPAPWLHRQRSRTDVGLSSTTSPKSARRGRRVVTVLLAIFSLLRALGVAPTDPLDVVLRGRTSPCRSCP